MSYKAKVLRIIPPLSHELHKGQAGRVGVVGGCKDYTGAPYFSAYSSILLGADLAHIICDTSAGDVIKTYSPDLIVHRIIDPEISLDTFKASLESLLPRLHTLIVGPGLGRDKYMQDAARESIRQARSRQMYLVLDADALHLIENEPNVISGYSKAVLTPNVVEFRRLCNKLGIDVGEGSDPVKRAASMLSTALGNVTIVQKGKSDIIVKDGLYFEITTQGGLKRCGGQGDLLSGMLGTFLCWAKIYEEAHTQDHKSSDTDEDPKISFHELPVIAACGAAMTTRTASWLAFQERKRATQASDLLRHVGDAYEYHFSDSS